MPNSVLNTLKRIFHSLQQGYMIGLDNVTALFSDFSSGLQDLQKHVRSHHQPNGSELKPTCLTCS